MPRITWQLNDARGAVVERTPLHRESQRVEVGERLEQGRPLVDAAAQRAHYRRHTASRFEAFDNGLPEHWLRPDLEEDIVAVRSQCLNPCRESHRIGKVAHPVVRVE